MTVYMYLPNDTEFEFEADVNYRAGRPAKLWGPPEFCYPAEPDEAEFEDYGPFKDMEQAVLAACWINNCPISPEDLVQLASDVENSMITKILEDPPCSDE